MMLQLVVIAAVFLLGALSAPVAISAEGAVNTTVASAEPCGQKGIWLQVLGSGGPQLNPKRASSSYLIWHNGKARVLVDTGTGSVQRFHEAGSKVTDLEVILLSHLRVDHTADLPALIESSSFSNRKSPLPIFGPPGNKYMPSTVTFIRTLFDQKRGAYRYLGYILSPLGNQADKLKPHDVSAKNKKARISLKRSHDQIVDVYSNKDMTITALAIDGGDVPALAWAIRIDGKSIVFGGEAAGSQTTLAPLSAGAHILVMSQVLHKRALQGTAHEQGPARPAPADRIGRIAHEWHARQLLLSHRNANGTDNEQKALAAIRAAYEGTVTFVNDLECFQP